MSTKGYEPITVETFGGLVTEMEASDLPVGCAALCRDVQFVPGSVRSRDPWVLALADSSPIMSYRSYVGQASGGTGTAIQKRLVLFENGDIRREYPEGTLETVASGMEYSASTLNANLYMALADIYGKKAICITQDHKSGWMVPIRFDDSAKAIRKWSPSPPGKKASFAVSATAGSIPATYEYYAFVVFETESGARSGPSPISHWQQNVGSKSVDVTAIPIGPPGTTARRIYVSTGYAATTNLPANFWSTPSMVIPNNTATTATVDFDVNLAATGIYGDTLFDQDVLPPCVAMTPYNDRMVAWGCLNTLQQSGYDDLMLNIDFQGGFTTGAAPLYPLNWNVIVATPGPGKSNPDGAIGDCYRIQGDGAANPVGEIATPSNTRYRYDRDGGGQPGKAYSVRIRAKRSTGATVGNLSIYTGSGGGGVGKSWSLNTELYSDRWVTLDYALIPTTNTDTVFAIRVDGGVLPNNEYVDINYILVYETDNPYLHSTLRVSKAGQPETFDAISGFVTVASDNGQRIGTVFPQRGVLYVAKEDSLHGVQDTGDEPGDWPVQEASPTIGTPSVDGVARGPGWDLLVGRRGAFLVDGGVPTPISQEINTVWKDGTVAWAQSGALLQVVVHHQRQEAWIKFPSSITYSPYGGSELLNLNFREGLGDPVPGGSGRKWSIQTGLGVDTNQRTTGIAIAKRDDGTEGLYLLGGCLSNNQLASSVDFTAVTWPSVGAGGRGVVAAVADPLTLTGTNATRWNFGAASSDILRLNTGYNTPAKIATDKPTYVVLSMWVKPSAAITLSIDVGPAAGAIGGSGLESITIGTVVVGSWAFLWRRVKIVPAASYALYSFINVVNAGGAMTLDLFGVQLSTYEPTDNGTDGLFAGPFGYDGTLYPGGYVPTAGAAVTGATKTGVLGRMATGSLVTAVPNGSDFWREVIGTYQTAPIGPATGRQYANYLTARIYPTMGNLNLQATTYVPSQLYTGSGTDLNTRTMVSALPVYADHDTEWNLASTSTQLAVRIAPAGGQTGAVLNVGPGTGLASLWSLRSLSLYGARAPWTPLRHKVSGT